MRQWGADPFVAPSALDQRMCHRLDAIALGASDDFEAVQLGPVAPLGVCSVLAPTSQDRALTAQRGTEVVADPTNVLALESARRLQRDPTTAVRLCTVHQTLRAQALPKQAGFSQHFRLFALTQAGKGLPEDGFERRAVVDAVTVFDRMFDASASLGCQFVDRRARIFVGSHHQVLGDRVASALEEALPHVAFEREPLTTPYYDGLRVLFGAVSPKTGAFVPLGDTGRFDWVARLANNRKLRFVASGIGIQLFVALFAGG